ARPDDVSGAPGRRGAVTRALRGGGSAYPLPALAVAGETGRTAPPRFAAVSLLTLAVALAGCGSAAPDTEAGPEGSVTATQPVGPITDEMLQGGHAEDPSLWPTYGGDWAQTRYSNLTQIRRETIHRLRPAWIHQTGIIGTFSNTPVVIGHEMYVTTPTEEGRQEVLRLDSTTGDVVWRVQLERREVQGRDAEEVGDLHLPPDFGPHRGVAVYGDRIYMG